MLVRFAGLIRMGWLRDGLLWEDVLGESIIGRKCWVRNVVRVGLDVS